MQDNLVFDAAWHSTAMTAQDVVDVMRDFLTGLQRISPWEPPFDVSGRTMQKAHMPITEDLSDFDDVVLSAMDDDEVRFFSESEPEEMRIRRDSTSPLGMKATFSDYPQRTIKKHAVTVRMSMGSSDGSRNSGVAIGVPHYTPYQEDNGVWAMSDDLKQPEAVFDYLIDFFDPFVCSVYSSEFLREARERGVHGDNTLGWRSYVRSPRVSQALTGDPRVSPYREGVLISIGETPTVFLDLRARKAALTSAMELHASLSGAQATDWMI